jgi:predicted dehydrogenase
MRRTEQSPATFPAGMTRRHFLECSLSLAALASTPLQSGETVGLGGQRLRAAIIGHTGRGNYGHNHDLIFNGREDIEVVAVADPNEAGRAKAAARSKALRQYGDYRQMLEKEKPQLVCVAPRWTDEHHAMALAALRVGAHVYLEKPMTTTLAEADELLAAARQAGSRVVVAHQMRLAPNIVALKPNLEQGFIGELLEIRAHGKQDHRAGGEDLVVLGVHLFDLMRFFAGDPWWCAARVLQSGHEITLQDAHPATENIGPIAGDEVLAEFAFTRGLHATFASRAKHQESAGPWGLELIGSKGSVQIQMEMIPRIYTLKAGKWTTRGKTDEWGLWEQDPTLNLAESERSIARANRRVVDDWLASIEHNREAVCSGQAGMRALEMAMAVFRAGLTRERVEFPLKNRQHPLSR